MPEVEVAFALIAGRQPIAVGGKDRKGERSTRCRERYELTVRGQIPEPDAIEVVPTGDQSSAIGGEERPARAQ